MKKTILLVIALSVVLGPYTLSQVHAQDIYGPCPTTEVLPEKQGDNLLINPSFEWPYYYLWQEPGVGNGCIPSGWVHWYSLPPGDGRGDYFVPEWKPVQSQLEPQGVFEGGSSVAYYKPWAYHLAGMYQQVDVPANATLTFAAYGMAWSTDQEEPAKYDSSGAPNPVPMSIGIDPTGGTNPFSESIVWSDLKAPLDIYEQFSVQATAQGSTVTVFLWSHNGLYDSNLPVQWIDVFWDASSLRVSGDGGQTAPPSTDDTPPDADAPPNDPATDNTDGVTPVQAQPARDDGSQWHVVQPGDSLIRIAAAYGVETQTIRDLNDITGDNIFPDQELLIEPAEEAGASTSEDVADEDVTSEGDESVGDTDAGDEVDVAEEPAAELGQICMVAFDDQDRDGEWGQGEPIIGGATVNVTGAEAESYTTQAGEPFCVSEVTAGDYTVEVIPPGGYETMAGRSPVAVTVTGESDVALNVPLLTPAQATQPPAAPTQAPAEEVGPPIGGGISPLVIGLIIAGGGMIITSVVAAFIVIRQAR